jgi:1-deoxy-D-xylulose-5-phosphate synthase
MVAYAEQAAARIERELGLSVSVLNARFAKPLDTKLLAEELPKHGIVCTLEDHALQGGFGSAVLEFVNDSGIALQSPIKRFGVPDVYVTHASQAEQHAMLGYDPEALFRYIEQRCPIRKAAGF